MTDARAPNFQIFFSKRFLVWSFGFYNFFLRDFRFPEDWRCRNWAAEQIPQLVMVGLPFCVFPAKTVKNAKSHVFLISIWSIHLPARCVKIWSHLVQYFSHNLDFFIFHQFLLRFAKKLQWSKKSRKWHIHSKEQGLKFHFIS